MAKGFGQFLRRLCIGWLLLLLVPFATQPFGAAENPAVPAVPADPAEPPTATPAAPANDAPPVPDYAHYTVRHTFWLPETTPPLQPSVGDSHNPYRVQPTTNTAIFIPSYPDITVLSGNAQWLLTVRAEDTIAQVWDLSRHQCVATLKHPTGRVFDATLSPDGQTVITLTDDGTATLWDAATERALKQLALTSPDRVFFVSDKQIAWLRWNDQTGRRDLDICTLPGLATLYTIRDVSAVEFKPQATAAVAYDPAAPATQSAWLCDGHADTPTLLINAIPPNGIAWSGEITGVHYCDRMEALIVKGQTQTAWFSTSGKLFISFPESFFQAKFSPDQRYLGIVGYFNRIQVPLGLYSTQNQSWYSNAQFIQSPADWIFTNDSQSVAIAQLSGVDICAVPKFEPRGSLVSARQSPAARQLLSPAHSDRMLLCFNDRIEEWGPELDPLPKETDRAWTVYMDQLGLKHSLFTAAVYNTPAELRQAIADHPEWLSQIDDTGGTPLHYAIAAGRMDNAEVLLQAGCNPNQADMAGVLPLTLALHDWNLPILTLLERHGAEVPVAWGSKIYGSEDRANPRARRYGRVLFQPQQPPPYTFVDIRNWLADHDLEADPRLMAFCIHGHERSHPALAQKLYNRYQRIPIAWLALMQLLLVGMALLRLYRQRKQALDPEKQKVESESLRLRVYHENAWGDDSHGRLGLYPEEQRRLAELKLRRDAVLPAPLPVLLAWMSVLAVAAAIPYWWIAGLIQMNSLLLFVLGLTWIFGHLQSTRMRLMMHWIGILAGSVGALYGVLTAALLTGISDPFARWIYVAAGLAGVPMVVAYVRNLPLLMRIVRMEDQMATVPVLSNEEVKSETGWDEKHPEVF